MLSTTEMDVDVGVEGSKREKYDWDDFKESGRENGGKDEENACGPSMKLNADDFVLQRANVNEPLSSIEREVTTVEVNGVDDLNEVEEERCHFDTQGTRENQHMSDKRSWPSFHRHRDSLDNAPSYANYSNRSEGRKAGRCRSRSASSIFSPPTIIWPRVDPYEYHTFYWECMELKSELIRLDFALRSVGSGGPLIQATYAVKLAVMKLRDLYGMNTSALAPEDENVKVYNPSGSFVYLREFPSALVEFGDALDEMARALHDFNTVYHDEKLMLQLFSLHSRFKADAATFSLDNDFHSVPTEFAGRIQLLIGDWLKEAVTSLISALRTFTDKGIPAIQVAQNSMTSRYLNMTTIAFFLSGTTASMLQITEDSSDNSLGAAANTCLFSSLVFSVGSAVNSLLANGWRKSVVRDPDATLPLWSKIWLNAGPMISLLLSGAFFAAGVCLFVVASEHASWTSAITLAFTGFHVSGLMFLFGFFIQERWHFRKNAGSVGRVLTGRSLLLSGMDWANSRVTRLGQSVRPKASLDVMETGVGVLTKSMDVGKEVAKEKDEGEVSSESERSPGAVWHALSDEKFLLSSKYIFSPVIVRPRSRSRAHRFPRSRRYNARHSPIVQSPARVVRPDPGRWLSRIESSHSRNSSHSSLHGGLPMRPMLGAHHYPLDVLHMDHAVMSSLFVQLEPPAGFPPCQAPPSLLDDEGIDRRTEASVDDHSSDESQASDSRLSLPAGSRPEGPNAWERHARRRENLQDVDVDTYTSSMLSDEEWTDESESDYPDVFYHTTPPHSDSSHSVTGSQPSPVSTHYRSASVATGPVSPPVSVYIRRIILDRVPNSPERGYESSLHETERDRVTRRSRSPEEDEDRSSHRTRSPASPTRQYAGGRDGNEPLHHSEEDAVYCLEFELTDRDASPTRHPRTNNPRHEYSPRPDSLSQDTGLRLDQDVTHRRWRRDCAEAAAAYALGASAVVHNEDDEEDRGRSRRYESSRVHRSRSRTPSRSRSRSPPHHPRPRSGSDSRPRYPRYRHPTASPRDWSPARSYGRVGPRPPPRPHFRSPRPRHSPLPSSSSPRRYRRSLNHHDLRAGNDYGSAIPPLRIPPSLAPPIRAYGNVQSAALFLPSSSLHRASQPQRRRGHQSTHNG